MTDPQNETKNSSPPEYSEDDKLLAILAYVPIICLFPFMRQDKNDFVAGHVRLGMTLFVIEIFALILRFHVIWDGVIFLCILAAISGIYHVVQGKSFFVPFISDLFSRK